ncbi:hypothetical protein [Pseudomonas sp. H1h]|uniref:hypothetical protein n=1 Tax=Pseudomonas sp. H1h TaxID=1397280 RepID=UPI0012FEA3E8|nr:hypothetical protein [Pseudomonas sp. H1h]
MSDANLKNNFHRLLSRPFTAIPYEDKSHTGDHRERLEVIYKLQQRTAHIAPQDSLNLEGTSLTLESGSSLEQALQPGIASLKKFEKKPRLPGISGQTQADRPLGTTHDRARRNHY